MKYIIDIEGDLPAFGALARADKLGTCTDCRHKKEYINLDKALCEINDCACEAMQFCGMWEPVPPSCENCEFNHRYKCAYGLNLTISGCKKWEAKG